MKRIGSFIKNIYRVTIAGPDNRKKTYRILQEEPDAVDKYLKRTIQADSSLPDGSPDIQMMLEERVASKGKFISEQNAIAGFFLPLFSLKNLELKMVAFTLALIMLMRIGPVVNHSMNRNLNPSFLADTLIDSSYLKLPMLDSAVVTE